MKAAIIAILMLLSITLADAQSGQPAPVVSAAVNQAFTPLIYTDWPLIIEAKVYHPQVLQPTVTPITIDALSGSWENWFKVKVSDINGNVQNWPIHSAMLASGSLTLGYNAIGALAWWVNPSDVTAIPPGNYQLSIVLNTTADTSAGWKGMTSSHAVNITIAIPPNPLPTQTVEQQYELFAAFHRLQGNKTQALADIATLLKAQPSSVGGLWLQGDLFLDSGQPQQALTSYNAAVKSFYSQGVSYQEPPTELLRARAAVQNQLVSQTGIVGVPKLFVSIAGQGVQAPGVVYVDLQLTNTGTGDASSVTLNQVSFRTLSGTGTVTYDNTLSPTLPVSTQQLLRTTSTTIRVFLNVPATVFKFSMSEGGQVYDMLETGYGFAVAQAIIP